MPNAFDILEGEIHGTLFFETFRELPQSGTVRVRDFAYFGAGPSGARFGRTVFRLVRALVGAGPVTMTNGAIERLRCKAAYAVNATGKAVQQTLRCASDSYRLEISSNVISEGGSLSGSWAEVTRGVSGNISGRASGAEIVANVPAAGFAARLDVRTLR